MPERMRFLESRLQVKGTALDPEVVQYLALRVRSSQRDLEGAVNRVLAYARITAEPITTELAARALQALSTLPRQKKTPQPTELLDIVSRHLMVDIEVITSNRRDRAASYARHLAMFLLRHDAGLTYSAIASLLHRSDHSTVVHACSQIEHQSSTNTTLKADIDAVRAAIQEHAA
jgi:chromosomal replication initiator protein